MMAGAPGAISESEMVAGKETALSSEDSEGRRTSSSEHAEALLETQEQNVTWLNRTRATSWSRVPQDEGGGGKGLSDRNIAPFPDQLEWVESMMRKWAPA
jgi:hypothetical protein